MASWLAGKIRQPHATVAGLGMPVQLEVAILAADAGGAAPARRQQAGTFFRRGVGVGKAIVDRIKLDSEHKGRRPSAVAGTGISPADRHIRIDVCGGRDNA